MMIQAMTEQTITNNFNSTSISHKTDLEDLIRIIRLWMIRAVTEYENHYSYATLNHVFNTINVSQAYYVAQTIVSTIVRENMILRAKAYDRVMPGTKTVQAKDNDELNIK